MNDTGETRDIQRETVLYEGSSFDFLRLDLKAGNGAGYTRGVVRHRGAVTVLPLLDTPDGPQAVLVRNNRVALGAWLDELPAGGIEPGEAPEAAAVRELREETGYSAATIQPLFRFYTTPGITDELMHVFVATGLTAGTQDLDDHELLTVVHVPVGDLLSKIDAGEILDGKTITTMLMARRCGLVEASGAGSEDAGS